ncbi:MAG: branched-chain amino acid ABC transporter permease [Acidimicrobiia bacterium]
MTSAVVIGQVITGFDKFANALINGLALGAVYALLALGFVLIFKATQVVNFAHGALAAVGAFLTASFATVLNFPGRLLPEMPNWAQWALSALFAVLAAGVVGLLVERIFIRPMIGEPLFSVAIITIGVDIILRTINDDFVGQGARSLGDPWGIQVVTVGNLFISQTQIVTVAAALLCFGLVAWFLRSRVGVAMRATAFDQEAAQAQGINVGRVFSIAWGIGAGLAAVAGIFSSVAPRAAGVTSFTAFVVFRAFPAIIIGGLDSILGAVVGGFLVGLAEVIIGTYTAGMSGTLGVGFGLIVPYLLMLTFLLFRPYGLFGTAEIRRV